MSADALVDLLLIDAAPYRKPLEIARAWFEVRGVSPSAAGPTGAALVRISGRDVLFVATISPPQEALAYFVAWRWLGPYVADARARERVAEILGTELCKRSQEDVPRSTVRLSAG